tara:strand:+ start:457 stop:1395 length:939 start_codon:yes stop_codon:yes gene_type:complete
MYEKPIFVHLPKTGGSSIAYTLLNVNKIPDQDKFYYRHIRPGKVSNIFYNPWIYVKYNIIITFRHPLQRLESEYNFIRYRKDFALLFNNGFPKNFTSYIQSPIVQNSMLKFLIIYDSLYKNIKMTPYHLNIYKISSYFLNIIYTFTEDMQLSHANIEDKLRIKLDNIPHERINIRKENSNLEEARPIFEEYHSLDVQLYEFVHKKFVEQTKNLHINDKSMIRKTQYNKKNINELRMKSLVSYLIGRGSCFLDVFVPNCCDEYPKIKHYTNKAKQIKAHPVYYVLHNLKYYDHNEDNIMDKLELLSNFMCTEN